MRLSQLVENLKTKEVVGSLEIDIKEVVYDSRKVTKDCVFICMQGANFDSHEVIKDVIRQGASSVIVNHLYEYDETFIKSTNITILKVEDTRYALACISAAWFSYPTKKLKTIGITGTKGKTTTTYMVKSILDAAGYKTGLIGTIETMIGDKVIPALNTTPESYLLQQYFSQMVEAGCDIVVMEVSSQGLMLHRTAGFIFDIGIFTNLEPDHIGPNEHASFDEYLYWKGKLFEQCKIGIINGDDTHFEDVIKNHTCEIERYGMKESNDIRAEQIELKKEAGKLGVSFQVTGKINVPVEIYTPGKFSVYNGLTAVAICRHFNVKNETIQAALLKAKTKGRIEPIHVNKPYTLMIDYAHNAMSLKSLLTTLAEYKPNRIISVFGCGGNRSVQRRYEMGEISGNYADLTIITSDNPRFEEPQAIIEDIKIGMAKTHGQYIVEIDRKQAIKKAMELAVEGDIIVLAGKGHETYQEIKGVKYPMDERVLIQEIMDENNSDTKE